MTVSVGGSLGARPNRAFPTDLVETCPGVGHRVL